MPRVLVSMCVCVRFFGAVDASINVLCLILLFVNAVRACIHACVRGREGGSVCLIVYGVSYNRARDVCLAIRVIHMCDTSHAMMSLCVCVCHAHVSTYSACMSIIVCPALSIGPCNSL